MRDNGLPKGLGERMFDSEILNFLVCPACHGAFAWDYEKSELICCECELAYPIRDGIPVLLADQARKP